MGIYSKLFESILSKPELVIGAKSVSRLYYFMRGFQMATGDSYRDKFYEDFQQWVKDRFGISQEHSWMLLVLFYSFGDENNAFEFTKKLWEEFKSEREQTSGTN